MNGANQNMCGKGPPLKRRLYAPLSASWFGGEDSRAIVIAVRLYLPPLQALLAPGAKPCRNGFRDFLYTQVIAAGALAQDGSRVHGPTEGQSLFADAEISKRGQVADPVLAFSGF